eukprot:XP_011613897.1 PREDICTED: testosterone 17-beta-dehydrogenase 3 [Takifugu rubripes]
MSMEFSEQFFICVGTVVFVYYGVKLLIFSRMLFPKLCFPLPNAFMTSMGEWAVVTGSSEGIGRAYAFELAKRGMNVVIMSRNKETLDQDVTRVINCNVRTVVKMCKMILPGMENRGKGLILNVSSGIASIPFPMYTLYAASKVFVERFSQGLQAEYKDKGIIIQVVAPFGVSTRMAAFQQTNMVTLSPEDFVQRSLLYLRAGDKTYGNVSHIIMGWVLQHIPLKLLYAEATQRSLNNYVKRKTAKDQGTK